MLCLWLLLLLVVIWRLVASSDHLSKVPQQVPWSGTRGGFFSPYLLTQIRGIWNMPQVMNTAYQKYSKSGSICAVALPFSRPEILLPRHLIHWMTTQSSKVLSPTPVQLELVAAEYAFLNSFAEKESVVVDVLRVQMNRHVPALIPRLAEELTASIDETFGSDCEWKEVQTFVLVRRVVANIITWLVVGDDLFRNQDLVDNLAKFSTTVIPSAMAISLFPPFLRPIASHLTCFFNRFYMNRALKVLGPYIQQRIVEIENGASKTAPHNDVLTWHIEEALRKKEPRDTLPDVIASRVFATVMAALESITLTITHTLFRICATEPSVQIWDILEAEATQALSAKIDQDSVNELRFADSAIKEALRLQTALKALSVQVLQPDGITLDEFGVHLPQGSRVSVSAWGIHHDEDIYPNAYMYDAFRFMPRDDCPDITHDSKGSHSLASASETFLSFGYGKHACPGRHLAAAVMKLFLAHVATNYELKQDHDNPRLGIIGHLPTPPTKAKLRIRRKNNNFFPKVFSVAL